MRTASVANGEGARLAAAVSLLLAAAKVDDHVADGDGLPGRRPVALAARRVAGAWTRAGRRGSAAVGFDAEILLDAVERQAGVEALAGPGTPLVRVTEPTETATAAAFAHTALLAGRPGNAAPLAEAGRLFGRLAHLLDAVEDQEADAAAGAWNPLTATSTSRARARRLADDAVHGIRLALRDTDLSAGPGAGRRSGPDGTLAHTLLVHELPRSVDRAFGTDGCAHLRGAGPDGAFGPPPGPHRPHRQGEPPLPTGPYDPRDPHSGGRRTGGPAPLPPGRGFWAGCAAAAGLCCTCRVCCGEFEGPWSGRRREGWCSNCDDCSDCCDCCSCGECCDGCDCCDCGCDCGCG